MAIRALNGESETKPPIVSYIERVQRIIRQYRREYVENYDVSDTVIQAGFTSVLLVFCDASIFGIVLRCFGLWTQYKVHQNEPEGFVYTFFEINVIYLCIVKTTCYTKHTPSILSRIKCDPIISHFPACDTWNVLSDYAPLTVHANGAGCCDVVLFI